MRHKVLERPSGKGQVLRGSEVVFPANYRLTVTQEMHPTGTHGDPDVEVEGLRDIAGVVDAPFTTIGPLLGEQLVLLLSDGRKLPFFFQSTDGSIRATGGFDDTD